MEKLTKKYSKSILLLLAIFGFTVNSNLCKAQDNTHGTIEIQIRGIEPIIETDNSRSGLDRLAVSLNHQLAAAYYVNAKRENAEKDIKILEKAIQSSEFVKLSIRSYDGAFEITHVETISAERNEELKEMRMKMFRSKQENIKN